MILSVDKWAAWAPGIETPQAWREWSEGTQQAVKDNSYPGLPFLDPLFKRRLSQLSRMVLQVGHDLMAGLDDVRVVFASHYGEIAQQHKISKSLIETGEVAPASFSLSVFNTPAALLSIATRNHGYSTAHFGGRATFETALLDVAAHIHQKPDKPVLLIVADELIPLDYDSLIPGRNQPYACGFLFSRSVTGISIDASPGSRLKKIDDTADGDMPSGLQFLSWFIQHDVRSGLNLNNSSTPWEFRWA